VARLDPGRILDRLKAGEPVPDAEIDAVARELAEGGRYDPYTLIHILGRTHRPEYRFLVEPYLDAPDDPMHAEIALMALGWMGVVGDHLPRLRELIAGVPWDEDGGVRLQAMFVLGHHLADHPVPEMFAVLVAVAEDAGEEGSQRRGAVRSLAHALGIPEPEIVDTGVRYPAWRDDVVARARLIAESNGENR
jgi:hypothetical protein